jgi:ABC-type transporter Mla MlaB component
MNLSVARDDVQQLATVLRASWQTSNPTPMWWDVSGIQRPDLAVVDALARQQLAAHRRGSQIRLLDPSRELRALLDLVGLADVLPVWESDGSGSDLEVRREPE